MPNVPAKARNTIQGTVRVGVAVEVDAKGKVKHADLESAGTSRYFAKLALAAARGWKFTPASSDGGNPVRSWILRFEFRRSGTEVQTQAVVR
jgi:TonB family protein